MHADIRDYISRLLAHGYVANVLAIAGFLLAFFLVARLMSEKKAPANTFAWLLVIILIPYVGVPLYLLFGGRKLRRLAERKSQVLPKLPDRLEGPAVSSAGPIAHTVVSAGGSPPVGGNNFRLLTTGEDEFESLARLIREARSYIHITTLHPRPRRHRAGDRETPGRAGPGRSEGAPAARRPGLPFFPQPLRQAPGAGGRGGRPLHAGHALFLARVGQPAQPPEDGDLRPYDGDHRGPQHRPGVHGTEAFSEALARSRHAIEGPAAALLNEVFIADWCFTTRQSPDALHAEIPARRGAAPRDRASCRSWQAGPTCGAIPSTRASSSMIQEAEQSIWLVTPYFIPDDVLLRSLIVKARAGREVTLIVPARSNHPITDFARHYYTRELRLAGARILHYTPGMLHAKAVVVDGRAGLVGSANFDLRSLFVNFEIGVFAYSEPDVAALKAWMVDLAAHCQPAPERRRGLTGNVIEDLSRLLAPLLYALSSACIRRSRAGPPSSRRSRCRSRRP